MLLPVLGDHYGHVLDRRELALIFDQATGAFSVDYHKHGFPIDPREYPLILGLSQKQLEERLSPEHPSLLEFQSLITAFGNLPPRSNLSEDDVAARDKELFKQRLLRLASQDADIHAYLQELLREYNGAEDHPADIRLMHELLERQAYRLAYWRVASDEINYRRFFDINELASLRMEDPDVFEATHALVLSLIKQGKLQGLRIDHPDGLHDPARYFSWIQAGVATPASVSEAPSDSDQKPFYLIAEKVLSDDEQLPRDWLIHGTTGYDFAALCNGLFVDGSAAERMEQIYFSFTGERIHLGEVYYQSKKRIMQAALASELNVLANQLYRISEADPHTRDFTLNSLRFALSEIIACFPVYRTYITDTQVSRADTSFIEQAIAGARKRSHAADITVFDFIREVLLTTVTEGKTEDFHKQVIHFAMQFQQYTAPVMAKGVEDTAFYIYNRLVSLNEVGGNPARFGITVDEFHRANLERRARWPHTLLCTSTHDTKRSEDVRARLAVLSEIPAQWEKKVNLWARLNSEYKRGGNGERWPDRNLEYLLYQTLVGAWPLEPMGKEAMACFTERIQDYMLKAAREAKLKTSWINPNTAYEEALRRFITATLDPTLESPFIKDFLPFAARVAKIGLLNSLSQVLLKLLASGVPDIYQGTELWDFSLVDPDNRRPVDYEKRRSVLNEVQRISTAAEFPGQLAELVDTMADGRIKMYLTWKCLTLRRQNPQLFRRGVYIPMQIRGDKARHLCAFARQHKKTTAIAVAPRLFAQLINGESKSPVDRSLWRETWIDLPQSLVGSSYTNFLTGRVVPVEIHNGQHRLAAGTLLEYFPVALICNESAFTQ